MTPTPIFGGPDFAIKSPPINSLRRQEEWSKILLNCSLNAPRSSNRVLDTRGAYTGTNRNPGFQPCAGRTTPKARGLSDQPLARISTDPPSVKMAARNGLRATPTLPSWINNHSAPPTDMFRHPSSSNLKSVNNAALHCLSAKSLQIALSLPSGSFPFAAPSPRVFQVPTSRYPFFRLSKV